MCGCKNIRFAAENPAVGELTHPPGIWQFHLLKSIDIEELIVCLRQVIPVPAFR